MKSRIYNLDISFKILGMGLDDLMLLIGSWFMTFQVLGGFVPERGRLLFGLASTAITFMLWRSVKDHVPSGFIPHFLVWLGERPTYDVTPDTNPQPVWIDPTQVSDVHAQEQRAKRIVEQQRQLVGHRNRTTKQ